ncbi:TolC family protein [Siccirubricoccus sp. KC 17139]|uniref:TolC family protein n=1 Tax=Siccirubricoccus soli TaxID=2899147 RepID=A0ABT1D077_9PROT|nr:TolC family protein [Siccirubricoccus soli]MCO6415321.1 TolC family protein [Siccirubricoccus soli]MCP2681453.1 TolC family protein [Siccirubricoccus soli]
MRWLVLPLLFATAPVALSPALAQQTPLSPRPLGVPPAVNPPPPPVASPPVRPGPAARAVPAPVAAGLAQDLEAALEIDAVARGLAAQRDAVRARDAQVRSPIAGSPAIGGSFRADTRGVNRAREWDVEIGAPLWLPGQRSALAGTVEAGVAEQARRLALRRLEVAALLRDAYWAVGLAEAELAVARDRLATARDVARDLDRRAALGDISATDALLGRNEVLSAELELARAEAARETARAAYATLTGGSVTALAGIRPEAPARSAEDHPALVAAEAALATAEAQSRLVAATPIDNPEVGLFTRRQGGNLTEDGYSFGIRLRVPLPTDARNTPRRAEAEAGRTRASADLAQARRTVQGEIALARVALNAAEAERRLAAQRKAVADQQLAASRAAFRAGEIGAFDLFRVRQLQIEAQAADARAVVAAGRARSRLNQAMGAVPGG